MDPLDNESTSIARGVFVYKKGVEFSQQHDPSPIKRRRKKGGKRGKLNRSSSGRQASSADEEDDKGQYGVIWKTALDAFKVLQEETFHEVLNAVTEFCAAIASGAASHTGRAHLPTAALLTGVNLPDHEFLFGLLASRIQSAVTPHVARLRASASGGSSGAVSLRAMTRSAVAQLMLQEDVDGEDAFETDEDEDEQERMDVKRSDLVIPVLRDWYVNQYSKGMSPKKKKKIKAKNGRRPLVLILEDLERFSASVLQDFILNLE